MRHELNSEVTLPAPIDDVFEFFGDAQNLELITPPELRFKIESPLPIAMHVGTTIDYTLRLFGVRFRWHTRITRWDPPLAFVDEQERGPYKLWIHLHTFEETNDGTVVRDRVDYRLPFEPIGDVAHPLIRRQLSRIFGYRREAIRRVFGGK